MVNRRGPLSAELAHSDSVVPSLTALIDLGELQRLQDAFAEATGVASVITTTDGRPITVPSNFTDFCQNVVRCTAKGLANCLHSDAELGKPNPSGPIIRRCLSAGLWDGGASIFAGEHHIGNWLIGQVRNEAQHEVAMRAYARDIGVDEARFVEALLKVPVMPTRRFMKICDFLFMVANQLSQRAWTNLRQQEDLVSVQQEHELQLALEARLRQSQKMEAVGRLAGGVAHDFNNLLTVISGNLGLLQLTVVPTLSPDDRALFADIALAADRAAGLTRQMLAFSRQQHALPRVVDAAQVLREFHPFILRTLSENIRLEVRTPQTPCPVLIDRVHLEQTILNLVVNAHDAMPECGLLALEVATVEVDELYTTDHPELAAGRHVRLTVRDSGMGIAPGVLSHIFEPFFTTKALGKGTGLGLPTVFGIVQQAKGLVTVYSEPGKGSTFGVYLPLSEQGPEAVKETLAVAGGDETLLVCEDSPSVRLLTARLLREAGYQVLLAESGEQAVELAASHPGAIHLLVSDVILPGIDGWNAAQQVMRAHPEARTLFVSGYTANSLEGHGVLGEGNELLEKPYTRDALLRRVRELLDRRG